MTDTTGANKFVPLLQLSSAEPKKVCWVQKSQDMDVSTSALGQLQTSPHQTSVVCQQNGNIHKNSDSNMLHRSKV